MSTADSALVSQTFSQLTWIILFPNSLAQRAHLMSGTSFNVSLTHSLVRWVLPL